MLADGQLAIIDFDVWDVAYRESYSGLVKLQEWATYQAMDSFATLEFEAKEKQLALDTVAMTTGHSVPGYTPRPLGQIAFAVPPGQMALRSADLEAATSSPSGKQQPQQQPSGGAGPSESPAQAAAKQKAWQATWAAEVAKQTSDARLAMAKHKMLAMGKIPGISLMVDIQHLYDLHNETMTKRQAEPLPSGLVFERVLGTDPDAARMFILCDDPRGSGGKAVVVAKKSPWTEAELVELVTGESNELVEDHRNDKFSTHAGLARTGVSLTLISPANEVDINKYGRVSSVLVRETAALYEAATRPFIDSLPAKQIAWVHAILDRTKELDRLMFEDEWCMLVPDTKWDRKDPSLLYALAILKDRTLRSVRDLRGKHAQQLRQLRDGILESLQSKFGIRADQVRSYFHYLPSFWHAHIHFNVLGCPAIGAGFNASKALLLDDVIDSLERDEMHSTRTSLTFECSRQDKLYAALQAASATSS